MKKFKLIGLIVLFAIVFSAGLLIYSGLFSKVTIEEREIGSISFVGVERVGNYKKSAKILDTIQRKFKQLGLKPTRSFGIYRDNPEKVAPEQCRSMIGFIVEPEDTIRREEFKRYGLVTQTMGRTRCVTAEFPFKTNLSIILGVMKVYPEISKHFQTHNYQAVPSLEIYDKENSKIIYAMEIKR